MNILRFFVFLLICFSANAQLSQTAQVMNYMTMEGRFNKTSNSIDADGSPLLWEEWKPGFILFKNNYELRDVLLRYNAFDNFLEVKYQGNQYIVLAADYKVFGYFEINSKEQVIYRNLSLLKKEILTVKILLEAGVIYGIHNQIKISRGSAAGSGGLNPVKDKFQSFSTFCIIKEGVLVKEVPRTKRAILESLPDQNKSLQEYIKKNDIDLRDDSGLLKLLLFYEELKKE
jgi:hypothetical protein